MAQFSRQRAQVFRGIRRQALGMPETMLSWAPGEVSGNDQLLPTNQLEGQPFRKQTHLLQHSQNPDSRKGSLATHFPWSQNPNFLHTSQKHLH